jgi:hypothetical protein
MLVLGVAHVVLGALGALVSCAILIGGAIALFGATVGIALGPKFHTWFATGSKAFVPMFGVFLDGALRLVASIILVVAGIRVLDVAPSGRSLSMTAALTWTMVTVGEFFAIQPPLYYFLLMAAYPALVEILFMRKDWRAAFAHTVEP